MTIRYRRPDKKNALSIVEAAKRDMKFTLSIKPTEESGPTIIRNIYECFRMLGDAALVAKGIEADDHAEQIKGLIGIRASTKRPVNLVDNLRTLRHNINYYGYKPRLAEVEDAISIAKSCFWSLLTVLLKELKS